MFLFAYSLTTLYFDDKGSVVTISIDENHRKLNEKLKNVNYVATYEEATAYHRECNVNLTVNI
jgi:hypothetical protein